MAKKGTTDRTKRVHGLGSAPFPSQGERTVTELTDRDRDLFLALLDDTGKKPNKALRDVAARYRKHLGKIS